MICSLIERFRSWLREWVDASDEEYVEPIITHTPGVCGGRACVRGSRMPVWCLELFRRGGTSMQKLIDEYPHLTEDQIQAAWDYADSHSNEIEQDIRDQAMHDFNIRD